jgi:hypothetical protein
MYRIPLPQIVLFDRKELLRRIKESGFQDETGTEELEVCQMRSAQTDMMRWLIQRGQFTADQLQDFLDIMTPRPREKE